MRVSVAAEVDLRRRRALALLCVANFLVILDAQVVVLAMPSIERELGLAPASSHWVLSAYLPSFGGLLLLGGRVTDLLGRRRVFLAGTGLITGGLNMGVINNGMSLIGAPSERAMLVKGLVLLAAVAHDVWTKRRAGAARWGSTR